MPDNPQDLRALLTAGDRVVELLREAGRTCPDRPYATDASGHTTTVGDLVDRARSAAAGLGEAGVRSGGRVAVALGNSVDHIAVVLAVLELGAIWVPLNTRLRGESLQHQLRDSAATHLVAVPGSDQVSQLSGRSSDRGTERVTLDPQGCPVTLTAGADPVHAWPTRGTGRASGVTAVPGSVVSLMYTSGTTGPAKGVQVTDTMLIAAVVGAVEAADPHDGDVFYVWEPLFHIGGAQLILLPLVMPVTLALSPRLSTSRFWEDVAARGATHIHHLGGLLQMLLSRPPSPAERSHRVRVSWGAGATPEVWEAAEDRFGLRIHECYGMTETSSIVTVNKAGPGHGIGFPLPWFDTALAADGDSGELLVRSDIPGLITPGYLGNREATARSWADGWWNTGDVVRRTGSGDLQFLGRGNDSVRVRGENVSAWQVESVFNTHGDVEQCAAVGVEAEVGEQEILLVVLPADGARVDPRALVDWAGDRMPSFQLPRYVRVVDSLPMTPSRRVAKKEVPRDLEGSVDLRPVVAGEASVPAGRAPRREGSAPLR